MSPIDEFFQSIENDNTREIILVLNDLFTTHYDLEPKWRWSLPFYYGNTFILYLSVNKNDSVELSFVRGRELSDGNGLLLSKKRKQVTSTPIHSLAMIENPVLHAVIEEAIDLDQNVPFRVMR